MFKKWFGFGKKEDQKEETTPAESEEQLQPQDDESASVNLESDPEGDDHPVVSFEEHVETAEELREEFVTEVFKEEILEKEDPKEMIKEVVEEVIDAVEVVLEETVEPVAEEATQQATEEETIEEIEEEIIEEETIEEEIIEETEESVLEIQPAEEKKLSFFAKLKEGLTKTTKAFTDKIDNLFNQYDKIDDDLYEELEEILIMADIGMETTLKIVERLKAELVKRKISEPSLVKPVLKDVIADLLNEKNNPKLNIDHSPSILFVIGVNGAGKTTTIGKIARNLKADNKEVILAAADTFRAAAIDQLKVWGERAGVPVICQQEGSDPAAVVYDSIRAAKARHTDVLIIDTAGRLHNKVNLMNELTKIFKVIEREFPEAEKEVLLVLDATTGQNGLQQAKLFKEAANITGIVLTKLDGTAKGGIVLAINNELGIPIKLIGVGEGINDLQVFDAKNFADALIGD